MSKGRVTVLVALGALLIQSCASLNSSASAQARGGTVPTAPANVEPETTQRISVASDGAQANGGSGFGCKPISPDGRYVGFVSHAPNLTGTPGTAALFIRDIVEGTTRRINTGNGFPGCFSLSERARHVAFSSNSSNLVPDDTNGNHDLFVIDVSTGTVERINVAPDGSQDNRPRTINTYSPQISADGRYVTFYDGASNLVAGDTNNNSDIFVRDRATNTTELVSISSNGTQSNGYNQHPSISRDGRYVAFESNATNLGFNNLSPTTSSAVFVRDRISRTTVQVSIPATGASGPGYGYEAVISANGQAVAFLSDAKLAADDTDTFQDVYVRDILNATTKRVNVASNGTQSNGTYTFSPSISFTGRYVSFLSDASSLVPGDTNAVPNSNNDGEDAFVRDVVAGTTKRVSVTHTGSQSAGRTVGQAMSEDGRYVAFLSEASDFVPGDTNGFEDVFVRGPLLAVPDGGGGPISSIPMTLTAAPNTRVVGDEVSLLATLRDPATAAPVPDVLVRFGVVSGPNKAFLAVLTRTDAGGVARAMMRGRVVGTDLVQAWLDKNLNGVRDSDEQFATATVTWTLDTSQRRYVSLGDSVPYGHGLANPYPDDRPGSTGNNQGPASDAYPSQLAQQFGLTQTVRATGCDLSGEQLSISGAQLSSGNSEREDKKCGGPGRTIEATEVPAAKLSQAPAELVTIQGGADDIHFSECLLHVLTAKVAGTAFAEPCVTGVSYSKDVNGDPVLVSGQPSQRFLDQLANLKRGISSVIRSIAPHTKHIAVMNYYQIIPKPRDFDPNSMVSSTGLSADPVCYTMATNLEHGYADAEYIQTLLNQTIAEGIALAKRESALPLNITLIDVKDVYDGHEMCTRNPAVFSGELLNVSRLTLDIAFAITAKLLGVFGCKPCGEAATTEFKRFTWRSGHPNKFGHIDLANAAIAALRPILSP